MKKIIKHDIAVPLGAGISSIDKDDNQWLYLLPGSSLIFYIKEELLNNNPTLIKSVKITTFDQMMRTLMINDYRKMLTQSEQELLLKKAIEEVNISYEFNYFKNSINKTGWLYKVGIWIGEIKRAGITADELLFIWKEHSEKFRELAYIYKTYQQYLHQYSLIDHEEPYFIFLATENSIPEIFNYNGVITEQFYDFSPIQMRVLNKLGDNGIKIINHIAIDSNREDLFQSSFNVLTYLEQLGFKSEIYNSNVVIEENRPLNHIKKTIFSSSSTKLDAEECISLIATSGRKQEIEEVAAQIKHLVLNNGKKLEDIAIIAPQLNKYDELINKTMINSGIPLRISKKESLIRNPFVQSMLSMLRAFYGQKKDWINILSSPYFIWNRDLDLSRLKNLFRELTYPMSKEIWEEKFFEYLQKDDKRREELKPYDEAMKKFYNVMEIFTQKGTNEDYIQSINFVEKEFQIKENIKAFLFNKLTSELSFRDLKAYEKWQDLKRELLSIEQFFKFSKKLTLWEWTNSLIIACERTEYDFTRGKKEGVHLLQPNLIRGREFSAIFILGLVEGEFPKPIKNDWLLPDQERYLLNQKGFVLNNSSDYVNLQKYQFFQSLISTKDKIFLVYSAKSEEGTEYLRSFYIDECLNLFNEDSINKKQLELSDIVPQDWDRCVYDNQSINKIYLDLQKYGVDNNKGREAINRLAYYQIKQPTVIDVINRGVSCEYDRKNILKSRYDGFLFDKDNSKEVSKFIRSKVWSTTHLNAANLCRFSFFAKEILRLNQWKEPEESLSAIERGDVFHRILQRFFDNYREEKGNVINPVKEKYYIDQILNIAKDEWLIFKNEEKRHIDSILCDLDWNRILQDLKQIITHEMNWRKSSQTYFYPKYLEFSFGMPINKEVIINKLIDPKSIEEKLELLLNTESIFLSGKIDRVDVNDEGQYVIYDYKTGKLSEYKHIKEGINIQLQIYIFVLHELLNFEKEQIVGAGFYTRGKKNKDGSVSESRNRGIWKSSFLELVGLSSRVNSIDDNEWEQWIDNIKKKIEVLIVNMNTGDFAVLPSTECPSYCEFKRICRKDEDTISKKNSARGDI